MFIVYMSVGVYVYIYYICTHICVYVYVCVGVIWFSIATKESSFSFSLLAKNIFLILFKNIKNLSV